MATVLALAGVRRGRTVLDLLAGSGLCARAAAGAASEPGLVIALEPVISLLQTGQSKPSLLGWAPIHWLAADPRAVPLGAGSVDTVLCAPVPPRDLDLEQVLPEMERVMRPGGRIVIGGRASSTAQATTLLAAHGFALAHLDQTSWSGEPVWYLAARRS